MLTIHNILNSFPDFSLLTSASTDKEVSSISVMDAPDIHQWMKGGEFLITSGYTIATQITDFNRLVRDLAEKDVAALGIKLSRFLHTLPRDVVELASKLNFAIIEIPHKYSFAEIINPVMSDILDHRCRELILSEEMNRRFLQIGVADISYEKILDLLSYYVNKKVYYLNIRNSQIFKPHRSNTNISQEELTSGKYIRFDVYYQQFHYGTLFVEEHLLSFQARMAINHAITMFRLSIQTILSSKRFEEQRRNDFLSDLILNSIRTKEEIDFRAQEYGWKLNDGVFCSVIQLDNKSKKSAVSNTKKKHKYLEDIRFTIKERCDNCYYITFSNYVAFLAVGLKKESAIQDFVDLLSPIIEKLSKDDFYVTIGIGSYYKNITESYLSYTEARKAIQIGQALFGYNQSYWFPDLSLYECFSDLDHHYGQSPYLNTIEELNKSDLEKSTEYMMTLASLINADWKMSNASDFAMIHYNTMKNRVQRLKEVTGWSFHTREEKFQIEVAYKVFLLQKKSKEHLFLKRMSTLHMSS